MQQISRRSHLPGLAGWTMLTFAAAAIGAAANRDARTFYSQLRLPEWAPPSWLFGPVWTALYLGMAIAVWLVWRRHGFRGARVALTLFLVQLTLNSLWSWLFFGWHLGDWSFTGLVLLWLTILATLVSFWRLQPLAGVLFVPYLAWVTFAGALNYAAWQMNPQALG
jgi:tryptophan-rich sensory protein